jgi:hypothetical protein
MHRAVATILTALALGALPASAAATSVPGPNGKVVFASGRASLGIPTPNAGDADARIWVADYPAGTPEQVTSLPAGLQHRHPNWSPDHTKIVYAAGVAFNPTGTYALWIKDLRTGGQSEFVPAAAGQDRPAWSPDGTRIVYGSEGNLWVKRLPTPQDPTPTPLQLTNAGDSAQRAVWSADGNTLYYNRGNAGNRDIWKKSPVTPDGEETKILGDATDDWQPAVSPAGDRLCFLRGPQNDMADVFTATANGTGATPLAATTAVGDLNCVWSPDGTRVMYTLGAFTAGDLITRDSTGGDPQPLAPFNVAAHFDGNADWATDFSPRCDDRTVTVPRNGVVSIRLSCVDPDRARGAAAPAPESLGSEFIDVASQPAHGNIGALADDQTLFYTPAANFTGTDTFTYTATDGTSDSRPATITINVAGAGAGDDTTAPRLTGFKVSPKTLRRGGRATKLSFTLSEPAKVRIGFAKAKPGRRGRSVAAGSLTLQGRKGAQKVAFTGRLSKQRTLALGSYTLTATPTDGAGNRGASRTAKLRVVRSS